MKRLLITMIVCLLCSVAGMNAQTYVSVSPSSPVSTQLTDVRYEFVQSTLNNSQAFLIDKYTGKHFVFFHDPDGMPVELYEK